MRVIVACYTRVSAASQNLNRQLTATREYAADRLGADLADLEVYRDKSTGTNTDRSSCRSLLADAWEVDAVIIHEVSRVTCLIFDLERMAERLWEADVELHVVSEGLEMRPDECGHS